MAETYTSPDNFEPTRMPRWLALTLLVALLLLGVGLRLIDLTDQPLEFHPLRQLNGAIISRGMYYEMSPNADPELRNAAINLWHGEGVYEPRLVEWLIALTYKLAGGEHLWIGRLYSILFWTLGSLAMYDLVRRLVGQAGALVSVGFLMVLPFAVTASRTLQPDPLMSALIISSVWAQVRWLDRRKWGWALAAGLFGGLAGLIKPWGGLYVGLAALALVLAEVGLRRALRLWQVWLMAGVMLLIPAVYYFLLTPTSSSGFFTYWSPGMSSLRASPAFYVNWVTHLRGLIDYGVLAAALVGIFLLPRRGRAIGAGLWAAYIAFGLLMPFQASTHEYYSLPLIPTVAFTLSGLARAGYDRLVKQPRAIQVLALLVMLASLAYPAWISRSTLVGNDYRSEPAGWKTIAAALPANRPVIALTHADGMYLKYYGWRSTGLWPYSDEIDLDEMRGADTIDFETRFASRTQGFDYFLVTLLGDLDKQVELKQRLETYRLVASGDGSLLYDLTTEVK